jgi:hypothetical protein
MSSRTWRGDENVLDKQLYIFLQNGCWIVARIWVQPYKGKCTIMWLV